MKQASHSVREILFHLLEESKLSKVEESEQNNGYHGKEQWEIGSCWAGVKFDLWKMSKFERPVYHMV